MKYHKILSPAALLVITGCVGSSLQDTDPKSNISQSISNSHLATGLAHGEIKLAQQTEFDALDKGTPGLPVKWASEKSGSGSVTPGQTFSIGTATCRRYKRTIQSNGVLQSQNLTACKDDAGIWSILD